MTEWNSRTGIDAVCDAGTDNSQSRYCMNRVGNFIFGRKWIYRLLTTTIISGIISAGNLTAATITGLVQDHMTKVIIDGAIAILLQPGNDEFLVSTVSNQYGEFRFDDIEVGVYNIEIRKDGYFSNVLFDLTVIGYDKFEVIVNLLKKESRHGDDFCFMLGGIEVKAQERSIVPDEIETVRKIDSGEIEHSQASSLGDIISLLPGVEKSGKPGLNGKVMLGARSVATGGGIVDALDAFGTTIVIDGVEMTNDANAKQSGEPGNTGIDLRAIPADNIQSVEVLTGIGSVEYGNFAEGLVKVKTKTNIIRPKLKVKMNPDTKTASYSAGHKLKASEFNYTLDYGYSERDLRTKGDEYHRFYFKTNYNKNILSDRLKLRPSFSITKRIDSVEPQGPQNIIDYDTGYRASGSLLLDYDRNKYNNTTVLISLDLDNKEYYREMWVDEQVVINDSIYAGYVGVKEEIGKEIYVSGKLLRQLTLNSRSSEHKLKWGGEIDYQNNTGPGLILDSLWNYYGPYSSRRSYSFDEFPAFVEYSIYAEDRIKRLIFGNSFELMFGLRYDVFNPTGFNFANMFEERAFLKSKHGDFLSPRFNMSYELGENIKIRLGAGRSVKGISLAQIYKAPAFSRILYYGGTDSSYVAEESYQQYNPDLQAYATDKYELSLDWSLFDFIGLTATTYWSESQDRPITVGYPWGYDVNPDSITSMTYDIYENHGWREAWGVETSLRTKRYKGIQFNMNATYQFSHTGRHGLKYDSAPDTTFESIWYPASSNWKEKVILDYRLTYISQRFGIWLTFEAQHIPLSHNREVYYGNKAIKVQDGVTYESIQNMSNWYDNLLDDYGQKWVLNFRLSKSVFTNTEVSLYVNNVLDDRAERTDPYTNITSSYNSPIYYGLEMCTTW
ncbi:MAG: TonB-dependent receptor [Candidatus Neomarinimicrobiota bacterium]